MGSTIVVWTGGRCASAALAERAPSKLAQMFAIIELLFCEQLGLYFFFDAGGGGGTACDFGGGVRELVGCLFIAPSLACTGPRDDDVLLSPIS
jgi:hypothetical protein